MNVTIYHNPKCGTSRKVLAAIREAGIEPEIVQYVIDPPSKERLREMLRAMKESGLDYVEGRGEACNTSSFRICINIFFNS